MLTQRVATSTQGCEAHCNMILEVLAFTGAHPNHALRLQCECISAYLPNRDTLDSCGLSWVKYQLCQSI